jgi:glucose/arabinose dehydrogenase
MGHTTRTILFDKSMMYIGISSGENVDPDSFRARVRRVDIQGARLPLEFGDMEVFADGLRNPLAMAFDKNGRLWELDNGPDSLEREGFAGDDHPIEELNLLEFGKNYGYPFCFSQSNRTRPFNSIDSLADGFLDQFAWDTTITTDEFCKDTSVNTRPLSGVMSHSSPIQAIFLTAEMGCSSTKEYGKFPCAWVGDLVATLHGSWDRQVPAGYGLIRIPFVNNTPTLPSQHQFLGRVEDYETKCRSGGSENGMQLKCFRPAGIAVRDGKFYVGSGATNEIVEMLYNSAWGFDSKAWVVVFLLKTLLF